ncbi:hypothetical protein Y032_0119g882 [Ancylostoma ceylanicum]|nr:hypothetical protein Y032_0119g882 [Ancylostoma ceylanicum]
MKKALFLEDIAQAELSGKLEVKSCSFAPERVRYFWLVIAQRPLCMMLSIFLTGMTILILISECTFFIVNPTMTPAGIIVDYAAKRFHYKYTQSVSSGSTHGGLCLQLRPQSYRSVDRLVRSETVHKHLNGRDHTIGVRNRPNHPIAWPIQLRT